MDLNRFFSGRITEVIATTTNEDGAFHAAPMGIRRDGDSYHIMRYSATTTSENALRTRRLCANFTTDAMSWAKSVTTAYTAGDFETHADWDVPVLRGAHASVLFECTPSGDDLLGLEPLDSVFAGDTVPQVNRGFNALIEAAVLFTRTEFTDTITLETRFAELRRLGSACGDDAVIKAFDTLYELISK